ncbi:MAG TPA: hypothetical protein VGQ24_15855 [Gemmatimonadales bacterium]|nr:hypothetical protein [Gemmatimonadales bacterium]
MPWGIPDRLRAGDTWLWKATFPDYPAAEGWTPQYVIRGVGRLQWAASYGVAVGEEWTITIPASVTGTLEAGRYEWSVLVVGSGAFSGRSHTVETGILLVLANLLTAAEGDRQSYAEKTLAVIREKMAGRITDDIQSYMIGTRQVGKIEIRELMRLEAVFSARVRRERNGGQLDQPVETWL